jgi:predicted transcriptional regulator
MPRLRQLVEHDVFGNAQARDQRHVHLLLHQVDAQPFGIPRLADVTGWLLMQISPS